MGFFTPRCVKWRLVLVIICIQTTNYVSGIVINTTPSRIVAADLHSRQKPIVHPFRGPRIHEISGKSSKAGLFLTFPCNKSTLDICNDRCVLRQLSLRGNCDEGVCICVKNKGGRSYRPPAGKNGLDYKTNCSVKENRSKCLGHCVGLKRGLTGVCTEGLCECAEESSPPSERNLKRTYRQSRSRNSPRRIRYTRPRDGRGSPSYGQKYRGSYSASPKRKVPSRPGSRSKRRNDFYRSPSKSKSTNNPPKRGNFNSGKPNRYGVDRSTEDDRRRRRDDDDIDGLEALKNFKYAGGDREGTYDRPQAKGTGVPGRGNTPRPPTPKKTNNYDALEKNENKSRPPTPQKKNDYDPYSGGLSDATGLKNSVNQYGDQKFNDPTYGDARYGDSTYDDTKYGEPRNDDTKYGEPRYGNTKYGDSRYDNTYPSGPALSNAKPDIYKAPQPGINPAYEEDSYYGNNARAFEGLRNPGVGGPSTYDTYNPYGNQVNPYGNVGDERSRMYEARSGPAAYNMAAANLGNLGHY